MLSVNFKAQIGYYTETQNQDGEIKTFHIGIYKGNCLCVAIYHEPKEDGVINPTLVWIFDDVKHMQKCIRNDVLKDCNDFHFDAKELNSDTWKMVQELAKKGKRITIN